MVAVNPLRKLVWKRARVGDIQAEASTGPEEIGRDNRCAGRLEGEEGPAEPEGVNCLSSGF